MPFGTLERSPPPFFRQGLSALTKLLLFSALAVFLMAADRRFQVTQPVRAVLATALLPIERALAVPVELWQAGGDYLRGLDAARADENQMRARLAAQAERSARVAQLGEENNRLRALLQLRPALTVKSQPAEILYEAPDPFSRHVFLDRGSQQGLLAGSPVINESGVLGQVTRVYPLTAEVTLLVDKDAAIPVLNQRTQHRSAAYGTGEDGAMELRFMGGNEDVQAGDLLVTSGVDGVYPPGLSVAKVTRVDRRSETAFARITLAPTAQPDAVRHVLVLEPLAAQLPPRPETSAERNPPLNAANARSSKAGRR